MNRPERKVVGFYTSSRNLELLDTIKYSVKFFIFSSKNKDNYNRI